MRPLVGISFGDTNACVAVSGEGGVTVVPNAEGSRTTPTIVAFLGSGEALVGELARRQAIVNSANTVFGLRRLLGRRRSDVAAELRGRTGPFGALPSPDGAAWVDGRGERRPPEQLVTLVLGRLLESASRHAEVPARRTVVGVPTWFTPQQCDAMRRAARLAGLPEVTLVAEPIAVARAHAAARHPDAAPGARRRRLAVYDLGGSSFCFSIVECEGERLSLLASVADLRLGGRDFDERIIDYFAGRFLADEVPDLRTDPLSFQRLWEAAETVKCELSSDRSSSVNLPYIAADASGPRHVAAQLTRGTLEALVDDLIERSLRSCQAALAQADLRAEQIDDLIFVGGQTRMPRLRERVEEFFGRADETGLAPEEVVAIGAAHAAGLIAGAALEAQPGLPLVALTEAPLGAAPALPPPSPAPGTEAANAVTVEPLDLAAFLPPETPFERETAGADPVLDDGAFEPARVAVAAPPARLDLAPARPRPIPRPAWAGPAGLGTATGIWTPPTPSRPPRPRRRGGRYLGAGAVLIAALALVPAILLRPRPQSPAMQMVIPTASAASSVAIMVEVRPQHATVQLDGAAQSLPLPLLPRDGRIHSLRATAPGYRPAEVSFEADEVQLVRLTLERVEE
jgi:actin-like ATPase involved in cell morphogenesis